MHIHCLGLNHQTASVALREQMAFSEEQARAVLSRLGCASIRQSSAMIEMVILSTCNRVELYTASPDLAPDPWLDCLAEIHDLPREQFETSTYHLLDQEAISHLFRVAAGLDSLVLGEPQILGQVTDAVELARGQNTLGPLLSHLFQAAIYAGKRARAETHIGRNPASVPSLAARLAEQAVPQMVQAQTVVIGAGEMAELAVEALRKRGARSIRVVNRTLRRARELAARWDAQADTFEHLEEILTEADIVISSTGASQVILPLSLAARVMQLRLNRPLVAIDIAVPRDIDPQAASLPGFQLYDMDSLNRKLELSLAERLQEVPKVVQILAEEETRFREFLVTQEVLPVIAELHQQAEAIRQGVLETSLRRLPDLSEAEKDKIEAMTRALVKRLLDAPIMRLRAEARCPYGPEYSAVVRGLFGLASQDQACYFTGVPCPIASSPESRL